MTTRGYVIDQKLQNFRKFIRETTHPECQDKLTEFENIQKEDLAQLVILKLRPYMQHETRMLIPAQNIARELRIEDEAHIKKLARYLEFFTEFILS